MNEEQKTKLHLSDILCHKAHGEYGHLCTKLKGHKGACSNTFALRILKGEGDLVKGKIKLDTYSTPGDSKSVKNRANRCFPVKSTQQEVKERNERGEKGTCIRKKFSSTPEDCYNILLEFIAQSLNIDGLDVPYEEFCDIHKSPRDAKHVDDLWLIKQSLETLRQNYPTTLECRICGNPITLSQFASEEGNVGAMRVQTGHIIPPQSEDATAHVTGNLQWIHRDCNIIQGDKTEQETIDVCTEILRHHGAKVNFPTLEVENA
jgi:hypothetical protein